MRFRKLIFFLIFLLLLPQIAIAGCCNRCPSCTDLAGWWGNFDYLLIWRKKRFFPPLVTTSPVGTAEADAGVLGLATTSILFGDESINNSPKSGWAIDAGVWLNRCWGVGAGYFNTGKETIDFFRESNGAGVPILARPFFDVVLDTQAASLISFPAVTDGSIDINSTNNIWGYDLYARYQIVRVRNIQLDALGGLLFTRLDDDLNINTEAIDDMDEVTLVTDSFNASNAHYAGMVGAHLEWRSSWFILQAIGKVALGNMVKKVSISGETTSIDPILGPTTTVGGLLALPTNIGNHSSNNFEVVSMLDANALLCITENLFFKVGYTVIYWPNVALAGEQVDLNVNPTQFNGGTLVGEAAPLFDLTQKSFWTHGLRVGLYIVY